MIEFDFFDLFAFVVFTVLVGVVVVAIVALGSLPGKIAAGRGHPQAKAINAAAWISLITLGALWPLALIWALTVPRAHRASSEGGRPS